MNGKSGGGKSAAFSSVGLKKITIFSPSHFKLKLKSLSICACSDTDLGTLCGFGASRNLLVSCI